MAGEGWKPAGFSEGAWNIAENQVVMKLFSGAIEMAIWGKQILFLFLWS